MCAAMSHGHSFQSSIFRLPAKCSGCHELVWGPFTRGCTCLTCSVTVHRSCTGLASMPPCPRKDVFDVFCRSELGLPPLARREINNAEAAAAATAAGSASASTSGGDRKEARSSAGAATSGDLDEWATVEGTSAHSTSAAATTTTTAGVQSSPVPQAHEQPPASASCAVQDLGSSFFWSPLGFGERKRPLSADTNGQQQPQEHGERQLVEAHALADAPGEVRDAHGQPADDAADAVGCLSPAATAPVGQENGGTAPPTKLAAAAATGGASSTAAGSNGTIGIGGVTKLSVAGGVVGALFGGPVGAVVGLNFGAVLGAGRSVQQGLWQRIEKNRREAGAEGIGLRKAAGGTARAEVEAETTAATTALEMEEGEEAAREPRDAWARIAKQVEGEHQPILWELDPKQEKLLEQGECDAGEVAMFVVGKVLADETAMLYHLYAALLAEFRSRHRSSGSPRRSRPGSIRRRGSDTDMVALFPRSSGRRSAAAAATTTTTTTGAATPDVDGNGKGSRFNRLDSSSARQDGGFFASTPGLEKTYSFVEEAEMVAGEGSDTPSFDEDGPGAGSGGAEGNNGRRNDVRLSGARASECSSCGGRLTSGASQSGRHTRALTRDFDEDEGGIGDGWAEAEAPLCWCRDEAGFSASPEDERNSTLAAAAARRNGGTGRDGDAAEPRPGVDEGGIRGQAFSGAGRDSGRGDDADQPRGDRGSAEAEAVAGGAAGDERTSGGRDAGGEETRDPLRDVHGVLRELTRAVLEWCPLLTASHEAQIQAVNCIDQRVFSQTYGPVFERIAASGPALEGDTLLARRTRREERSRAADGRPTLLSTCRAEVVSALRAAGSARTGRDKLGFLVQGVERISDALPDQRTTDALIFSVCRHLAAATTSAVDGAGTAANGGAVKEGRGDDRGDGGGRGVEKPALARPHAEVAFVEQFMRDESWVMGKEGYVLTTVIAALHVLNDPDMSDDVFLDAPPQPSTAANSEDSGVEGDDAGGGEGAEITGTDSSGVSDDLQRE
ncbi:unnamed protein product [Scytosiphon promiscuus]